MHIRSSRSAINKSVKLRVVSYWSKSTLHWLCIAGQLLEQVVGYCSWPPSISTSSVSLREKLPVPEESPLSGLSFGISSFSLRDTGAEKFRVEHCVNRPVDTQINLGGRLLEHSSIWPVICLLQTFHMNTYTTSAISSNMKSKSTTIHYLASNLSLADISCFQIFHLLYKSTISLISVQYVKKELVLCNMSGLLNANKTNTQF